MKQTVCIDFDGVIHEYVGWDGNPPRGKLIEGVQTALQRLKSAGYSIVCHTARDAPAVRDWLQAQALEHYFADVTAIKPKEAIVFFDDRARFVPTNSAGALDRAVSNYLLFADTIKV